MGVDGWVGYLNVGGCLIELLSLSSLTADSLQSPTLISGAKHKSLGDLLHKSYNEIDSMKATIMAESETMNTLKKEMHEAVARAAMAEQWVTMDQKAQVDAEKREEREREEKKVVTDALVAKALAM